ncbi:MAG: hypothetical protein U0798_03885 [Gemmataceae bacterium]
MYSTFALITALSLAPAPGQPATGGITLTNVRNTHGELGGTRPDNKFIPGDVVFVAFDIEGLTVGPKGDVKYTMAMEVTDKNNKTIFKPDAATRTDYMPLGGSKLPGRAFITCGLDLEPGTCTLKLVVTDEASKQSVPLTRTFEVLKKDFGIAAVFASQDETGNIPAATTGVVGSMIYVRYGIVNFARDPATKQPNVMVEIMMFDEEGKPTVKESIVREYKSGVPEDRLGFPDGFALPFTRVGKFTVKIKATDKVANKSYTFELPVAAVPPG